MPKYIDIRFTLSEDLCGWIEGLIRRQYKPIQKEPVKPEPISVGEWEGVEEEEGIDDNGIGLKYEAPEGQEDPDEPHKRYKGVINWTTDPHIAFVRLYGKTMVKLRQAAEGYFGLAEKETAPLSRDQLIHLLLTKRYGEEVANEFHFSKHMTLSELEPLIVEELKNHDDWVLTVDVRQTLWDAGYKFNPKKIYDTATKLERLGVIEKDGSFIMLADPSKRSARDWEDLSDLPKQAIKTMSRAHSKADVARIVMDELELDDDDSLTSDRLAQFLTYLAENNLCPILSLGEQTREEWYSAVRPKCEEWLTERLDSLTS